MNRKIGNVEQVCTVQRVQVTDGRGKGARLVYVANGKLNMVLSKSNALDILRLWHEGAKVGGRIVRSVPRTEWSKHEMGKMLLVEPSKDNLEENCYFHQTADGVMTLTNRKLGKRVTVKSSLKKFVQWKSRASGDYAIGLEPCTSWLDGYLRYSSLGPGKSAVNRLTIGVDDI